MKKILNKIVIVVMSVGIVLPVVSSVPSIVEAKAANSIILDGDFEKGGDAWNSRNKGEIANGISYGDGNKSGVIPYTAVDGDFASGYIGQIVNLDPNSDYIVTGYGKVDKEGAKAQFTGRWWNNGNQGNIIQKDGSESGENSVNQEVSSLDWEKVEYQFNSGNHTQALIQLVKWSEETATKESNAYIDNVSVLKVGSDESEKPEEKFVEVWRDNFDQSELNMEDWGYELGSIRGIENQHYVNNPENIFLRDNNLVLKITDRAEEDHYDNPRDASRRVRYDSGSIRTHGKREFLYGKLEMRARMPKGQGAFPAFWTLGADFTLDGRIAEDQGHHWPASGEIDITELIGQDKDDAPGNRTVYQTIHYGPEHDVSSGKFTGNGTNYQLPSGNFNDEFHTFGLNWTEDKMEWYVDDKIVRTVPYAEDPLAKEIFSKPQYVQLNLAAGGAWVGPAGDNLDGTEFEIDYVSYSQTEEQKNAAMEYYASAPKLENIKPLEMVVGGSLNPVENITTNTNYLVDFSIEDEPMFVSTGGNTNVELLVSGVHELEKISKLPVGTYNLHYSAIPEGVDLAKSPEAKVARKSTTLIIHPDNPKEKVGWVKEGSEWYYYDTNGSLQTGWIQVDNTWYYMNSSGLMQTGWNKIGPTWYYMINSGAMQTGWEKVNGTWYYLNSSGAMQTGWNKVGPTWYYMNNSGAMQTGWEKVNGTWYYMNNSGAMQTGWEKVNSTWYYMNNSGAMQTGWEKVNGTWYYMNKSGAMQTGWNKVGPTWYYMSNSGAMQTGWVKSGTSWYYLSKNGSMQTLTTKINGRTYRFDSSGRML